MTQRALQKVDTVLSPEGLVTVEERSVEDLSRHRLFGFVTIHALKPRTAGHKEPPDVKPGAEG